MAGAPADRQGEWEALREVLWRKYQRGRCPWELINKIDKKLEDMADDGGEGKEAP